MAKINFKIEELLEIATQHRDELQIEPIRGINEVHRFIVKFDIKPGNLKVNNIMVYKAYKLWAIKPMSARAFYIRFSQFFESKRSKTIYYCLNYRAIELLNKVDKKKLKVK